MTKRNGAHAARPASVSTTLASINDELRRVADDLPESVDNNLALVEHRLTELGESLSVLRHRMDWVRWRTYHDGRLARVARNA